MNKLTLWPLVVDPPDKITFAIQTTKSGMGGRYVGISVPARAARAINLKHGEAVIVTIKRVRNLDQAITEAVKHALRDE